MWMTELGNTYWAVLTYTTVPVLPGAPTGIDRSIGGAGCPASSCPGAYSGTTYKLVLSYPDFST